MAFDVRPCTTVDEFLDALHGIAQYFGADRHAEDARERAERFSGSLPLERMHAARDNGAIVGGAGAFPFEMSIPGGRVACAGVTVVGVYPTHRRRGALRDLMRTQLDDVRERGEPIAALWASEAPIYGRFGYGLASWMGEMCMPSKRSAYARPYERSSQVRLVETEEAKTLLPPVWERFMDQRPGVFARDETWWENRIFRDPPDRREGGGPKRFVVVDGADGADAYAIYRHHSKWEEGVSAAKVVVSEGIGVTPQATADLWRYLFDIDWTENVEGWLLPLDHPLFLLLSEPRRMRFRVSDGLWVRLVDVGRALSARSYADGEPVVFEVRDEFCPWNEGRWRVGAGDAERTDDEPDVTCDVQTLGSVYLGGVTFRQLADAGGIDATHEAVDRADALFRTDVLPWCPEIF